jgi:hypothetical protein
LSGDISDEPGALFLQIPSGRDCKNDSGAGTVWDALNFSQPLDSDGDTAAMTAGVLKQLREVLFV